MNGIKPIDGLKLIDIQRDAKKAGGDSDNGTSFKETLKDLLNDVNDLQLESKQNVQKYLNGEISDVHQVMITSSKANISLELTMAIRNKLLDAYREIMRLH